MVNKIYVNGYVVHYKEVSDKLGILRIAIPQGNKKDSIFIDVKLTGYLKNNNVQYDTGAYLLVVGSLNSSTWNDKTILSIFADNVFVLEKKQRETGIPNDINF